MANTVTLDFAGDAAKLQRAAKQAADSTDSVGDAARRAGADMDTATAEASRFEKGMGNLGAATAGAQGAIDGLAGGAQALADAQDYSRATAAKLARAQLDVESAVQDGREATRDLAQSQRDLTRAQLDGEEAANDLAGAQTGVKRAALDLEKAQKAVKDAIKEHGRGSIEAREAALDLEDAQTGVKEAAFDVKDAQENAKQAIEDGNVALEDGRRANLDLKESQLNLNDAMHEANPPELQVWADRLNIIAPLLSALVGIIGLVTAVQWAWNAALTLNPIGLVIAAIVILIGIIVLIATKTTWFQDIWKAAWGGIKAAASAVGTWFRDTLWGGLIRPTWDRIKAGGQAVWDWMKKLPGLLKDAFSKVTNFIFAPFRAAFNLVADAWNNTIGRLSWTVPGWVPGVGGNSISAPRLPRFHTGGVVPGRPGQEVPIMALAGERVTPANRSGEGEMIRTIVMIDRDVLIDQIAKGVRNGGGNAQLVLGGRNA